MVHMEVHLFLVIPKNAIARPQGNNPTYSLLFCCWSCLLNRWCCLLNRWCCLLNRWCCAVRLLHASQIISQKLLALDSLGLDCAIEPGEPSGRKIGVTQIFSVVDDGIDEL